MHSGAKELLFGLRSRYETSWETQGEWLCPDSRGWKKNLRIPRVTPLMREDRLECRQEKNKDLKTTGQEKIVGEDMDNQKGGCLMGV